MIIFTKYINIFIFIKKGSIIVEKDQTRLFIIIHNGGLLALFSETRVTIGFSSGSFR